MTEQDTLENNVAMTRERCQRTYRRSIEWRTRMLNKELEDLLSFARLIEPGNDCLKATEEMLTGALLAVKLERRRHATEETAITILAAG